LDDADRLLGVGHGDRAHHVGARVAERPDLGGVVGPGLLGRHRRLDAVAVAARPDHAVDHDRRALGGERVPQLRGEGDRRRLTAASASAP
jgi:hypothetical protein